MRCLRGVATFVLTLAQVLASTACVGPCSCATAKGALPSNHASSPAEEGVTSAARLVRVSHLSAPTHVERGYYLYLPKGYDTSPAKRWPVLLFLHGNGERGNAKSELDYLLSKGPLYEAWIQKRDLPFILIAPQLPMYGQDEYATYLKNRQRNEIPKRLAEGVPARPAEFATPDAMTGAVAYSLPSTETP